VPEDINLEIFNADPITEDVSDAAPQAGTEAAPKTYAPLDAAAESQADLSAEMKSIGEAYAAALKNGAKAEIQPLPLLRTVPQKRHAPPDQRHPQRGSGND
jgi:protocatechuate 3,4-dioxygenase beta subunit